eukprot:7934098-Pyramimonas_sp.AAC.1
MEYLAWFAYVCLTAMLAPRSLLRNACIGDILQFPPQNCHKPARITYTQHKIMFTPWHTPHFILHCLHTIGRTTTDTTERLSMSLARQSLHDVACTIKLAHP